MRKIGEIPRVVSMNTSNSTAHRIQRHLLNLLVSLTAVDGEAMLRENDSFYGVDSPYPALSGSADKS